jgi:hypothetical protein
MQALVDDHYPDADRIRVVMDNLNTSAVRSLRTFPATRGPSVTQQNRISLHARTRQLAEHGGD